MPAPTVEVPTAIAFACELLAWLKRKKLAYAFRLYTPDEWLRMGHKYGVGADLVASIDGSPWYNILNGYSAGCAKEYEALTEFCHRRLWWWDMGYAWSVKFGPITDEQTKARMIARYGL